MGDQHCLAFGSFQLDLRDERLWRGSDVVRLKPKALAVLRCLLTHVGQLVTKEVLFATVWPDTVVSDAVLAAAIRELRRALGDPARTPHYIETVHGRGYRFIAAVESLPKHPPCLRPRLFIRSTMRRVGVRRVNTSMPLTRLFVAPVLHP
jgi:DNA-binding winged helix-turn-helix (wHTH) protein